MIVYVLYMSYDGGEPIMLDIFATEEAANRFCPGLNDKNDPYEEFWVQAHVARN